MPNNQYNAVVKTKEYFSIENTRKILVAIALPKKISAIRSENESELEAIADKLNYSALWYFTFKNRQDKPKNSEIETALIKLQKTASDFYQCLKGLDDHTKYFCLNFDNHFWGSAIGLAEYVSKKAGDEINKTGGGASGRPRETSSRKNFIYMLADIYESVVNRKAALSRLANGKPTGPFFRFVQSCLNQVGETPKDEALCKTIKDALCLHRKNNKLKTTLLSHE